jgi:hypothetical protein
MIIKNVRLWNNAVEKVFHLLSASAGRQEREEEVQGFELPVDHEGEALHLHDADEAGRGLEPDPVQSVRFYEEGLRVELYRDASSDHPREL